MPFDIQTSRSNIPIDLHLQGMLGKPGGHAARVVIHHSDEQQTRQQEHANEHPQQFDF